MTEQEIQILNLYRKDGDKVYRLTKKIKRNLFLNIFDFLLNQTTAQKELVFLITSGKEGLIVDMTDLKSVQIHTITEWTPDLQKRFRAIEIENYIYRNEGIISENEFYLNQKGSVVR